MDYKGRLERVRGKLEAMGLEALYVTDLTNIRYLTGFTGSNAQLFVSADAVLFLTDGRYEVQSKEQVTVAEVRVYQPSTQLQSALETAVGDLGIGGVGFESDHTTVAELAKIRPWFGSAELVPAPGLVEDLRLVKDADEIALIGAAALLADNGMTYISERVEVGKSELDLALDLEFFMRSEGSEGVAFEIIVAAGARSALPHARPTHARIEKGNYLLFDIGCVKGGYASDITRTFVLGQPDERHRSVYDTVLSAQEAALEAVKPGVSCAEVDRAARSVIAEAGFGEAFGHGLGHGVGLQIHEAPTLNSVSEAVLEIGSVITIEPGAYFEGWGGVRIEDLVVVEADGARLLSRTSKDLLVL